MKTLEDAIMLAAEAHRGQKDKAGEPYILHCLRVLGIVDAWIRTGDPRVAGQDPEPLRMIAVLHDLIEDTPASVAALIEQGCPWPVATAVGSLTRGSRQTYGQHIAEAGEHPFTLAVKLADLADNLDPSRSGVLSTEQRERYRAARETLEGLVTAIVEAAAAGGEEKR